MDEMAEREEDEGNMNASHAERARAGDNARPERKALLMIGFRRNEHKEVLLRAASRSSRGERRQAERVRGFPFLFRFRSTPADEAYRKCIDDYDEAARQRRPKKVRQSISSSTERNMIYIRIITAKCVRAWIV